MSRKQLGIFWSCSGEPEFEANFGIIAIKVVDINMGVDKVVQMNYVDEEEIELRNRPRGLSTSKEYKEIAGMARD